jgi:gas vesicle protein
MKNEKKGKGKGLLFGTFVGGTVGSIIALLYAPKSGEKLRENIKIKSEKIIVNAEKYITNTKKKTNKIISCFKRKSEDLVNKVEKNEDSLLEQSGNNLNKTRNKAELYVETGTPEIRNEDRN